MSLLNWWRPARNESAAAGVAARKKTVFLHVPKAAGTTLHHILLNAFPADSALTNVERQAFRDIDPAPYSFISGHFDFSYFDRHKLDANVITILRDPISRSISHFYFLRQPFVLELVQNPEEGYDPRSIDFAKTAITLARNLELGAFLEKERRFASMVLGNFQTRQLAGIESPEAVPAEADLEIARNNLRSCFHVGLSERMNESVARLCAKMGWPLMVPREPLNKTEKKIDSGNQPPRVIELLREINHLDLPLYQLAREIHEQDALAGSTAPMDLPDAGLYTPAMPILGEGWHLREKSENGWIVWSGPAAESWLELSTRIQGPGLLTCHLANIIHPEVITGLKVRLNETQLSLTVVKMRDRIAMRARVPQEALAAVPGRVRLRFSVERTWSPQELVPSSPDKRKLGFALESIRLEKASRFL